MRQISQSRVVVGRRLGLFDKVERLFGYVYRDFYIEEHNGIFKELYVNQYDGGPV